VEAARSSTADGAHGHRDDRGLPSILGYLVPTIQPLLGEFRAQGLPVFFSNWARRPGDGLYGALDRAVGFKGMSAGTNIQYTYKDGGLFPMQELAPTEDEVKAGHFIRSIHLDKFADVDGSGRSILSEKLRALGVDTLVLTGGWTEACIIATALDAVDTKNLDVVLVSDSVGTASPHQLDVVETFQGLVKTETSEAILSYMQIHHGNASYILLPKHAVGDLVFKSAALGTPPTSNVMGRHAFALTAVGSVTAACACLLVLLRSTSAFASRHLAPLALLTTDEPCSELFVSDDQV